MSAATWFVRVRPAIASHLDSLGVGAVIVGMQPLLVLAMAMFLGALPLVLGGLLLTTRRCRYAPRYWFVSLAASAAYLALDVVVSFHLRAGMARLFGPDSGVAPEFGGVRRQLAMQLAVTLAWTLYWARSTRVRATFGAAALDRTATAPAAAHVRHTVAPARDVWTRDGRWWRRLTLRVAGVAVAALLLLLAVGLGSMRASPYSVPAGADIRPTVAGRWTWASDTAGCRHAHTLAFAEGGRVMTIIDRDTAAAAHVTTYDIRSVSRSTIRGAIRGETRTTDAGAPVVWDLVLTGPDEYRWPRTDWRATPWSYTGGVRRCPAVPVTGTAGVAGAAGGPRRAVGRGRAVTRT